MTTAVTSYPAPPAAQADPAAAHAALVAACSRAAADIAARAAQQYTTRWLAFCVAHGVDPDHKPARLLEFTSWIDRKWAAYRAAHGLHPDQSISEAQHAAFDAWLAAEGGAA